VSVAKACLDLGVSVCGPGVPFSAIGNAIEYASEAR
jgi:methionine aminopeptidase